MKYRVSELLCLLALSCILFTDDVYSQSRPVGHEWLFANIADMETIGDVRGIVRGLSEKMSPDSELLLRDAWSFARAALQGRNLDGGLSVDNWILLDAAIKFVVVAAMEIDANAERTSDDERTSVLSDKDVESLYDEFRYPPRDDLIQFLLRRYPASQDILVRGEYTAIAFYEHSAGSVEGKLVESAKPDGFPVLRRHPNPITPYLVERFLTNSDVSTFRRGCEMGRIRRFNLLALPPIVLAAKASRWRRYIDDGGARTALIDAIMNEAFSEITLYEDAVFATIGLHAATIAQSSIERYLEDTKSTGLDSSESALFWQGLHGRVAISEPLAYYRLGEHDVAGRLFFEVAARQYDVGSQAAGLFGSAVSSFALGRTELGCSRFIEYLRIEQSQSRVLVADELLRSIGDDEGRSCGTLRQELARVKDNWGPTLSAVERATLLGGAVDAFERLRRPDLAIAAFRRCIEGLRDVGTEVTNALEVGCLRELVAFIHDTFGLISFSHVSAEEGWVHYPEVVDTDFPHNLQCMTERNGSGGRGGELSSIEHLFCYDNAQVSCEGQRPVGKGEVVLMKAREAYGALNPGEDLASSGVAYGVSGFGCPEPSAESKLWVEGSLTNDPPSFGPLVKAVFFEWFGNRFEGLKGQSDAGKDFSYSPCESWEIVQPYNIERVLEREDIPVRYSGILRLYLEIRSFLEEYYP